MLDSFGQTLRIGVAPSAVTVLALRRWGAARPRTVGELRLEHSSHPDALAGAVRVLLADAGGGLARRPATIVLADELVRLWHVTPPPGSTRLADLEGAAALRFQSLFGDAAGAWQISAGWDAARPFLAAAMPRALLAQLEDACAEHKVDIVEIVPQFVAGFNRWRGALKEGAWYANVHEGVLTLGALADGALHAVRATALPRGAGEGKGEGADLDWLARHVAREALRLNLAPPSRLQVSGKAPLAWSSGASHATLACTLLGVQHDPALTDGARLAATGSAA